MRKRCKLLLLIMLSLLLISSNFVQTHASAGASFLGVQRVRQAKSKWCWAAAAEMVGAYEVSNPGNQWGVVSLIYGITYPNHGGSIDNVVSGVEYASNYTKDAYHTGFISLASLKYQICDKGHPVGVRLRWSEDSGHVVVASGYNGSNIDIIDPWENTPTQYYPYSLLANGGTFATGTGRATHVILYLELQNSGV